LSFLGFFASHSQANMNISQHVFPPNMDWSFHQVRFPPSGSKTPGTLGVGGWLGVPPPEPPRTEARPRHRPPHRRPLRPQLPLPSAPDAHPTVILGATSTHLQGVEPRGSPVLRGCGDWEAMARHMAPGAKTHSGPVSPVPTLTAATSHWPRRAAHSFDEKRDNPPEGGGHRGRCATRRWSAGAPSAS